MAPPWLPASSSAASTPTCSSCSEPGVGVGVEVGVRVRVGARVRVGVRVGVRVRVQGWD